MPWVLSLWPAQMPQPEHSPSPSPSNCPRRRRQLSMCAGQRPSRDRTQVPMPQPPCARESFISSQERTALTFLHPDLRRLESSSYEPFHEPSWDSWRKPDTQPSGAQWAPSLQSAAASEDLARSSQPGEKECRGRRRRRGDGAAGSITNCEGKREGPRQTDREGKRGERRREQERARSWSNGVTAGGTSVMTATGAHTGGGARTGAHTPRALAAAGRAALTLETLTFQWKKRPVDSSLPTPGRRKLFSRVPPSIFLPGAVLALPTPSAHLLSLPPFPLPLWGQGVARTQRQVGSLGS